jgi:hypothetical protein
VNTREADKLFNRLVQPTTCHQAGTPIGCSLRISIV